MKILKENKGITMIALVILIILLLILSTVIIKKMNNGAEFRNYNEMCADIQLLHDKILIYYNKYSEIPKKGEVNSSELPEGGTYYEIDVSKLDNVTLNYGNRSLGEQDIYVINQDTLNVYYLAGLAYKGEIHYKK